MLLSHTDAEPAGIAEQCGPMCSRRAAGGGVSGCPHAGNESLMKLAPATRFQYVGIRRFGLRRSPTPRAFPTSLSVLDTYRFSAISAFRSWPCMNRNIPYAVVREATDRESDRQGG